jgi:hypothetical protein
MRTSLPPLFGELDLLRLREAAAETGPEPAGQIPAGQEVRAPGWDEDEAPVSWWR